ncbi:MAG TPA: ABC transporter permease [Roseiflexaceae bacterium]|nr:ABC transporter permease [Roseiflexaceae bacterium]HEU5101783.1 ABC transporter permease [Roseiflexaceae bacterium]
MATIITQPAITTPAPTRRGMRDLWRTLRRNPMGLVGLVMLVAVVLMAVFAPLLAPYDPYKPVRARLDTIYAAPSREHPLGTDDGGKDVLSSLMYGARVSLFVGFVAALITLVIGSTIGLVAGYYGGRIGSLFMRLTDIFLVIPDLPLYVVMVALLGPSIWNIILALALFGWTSTTRLVYAQVLSVKERLFVTRARAIGAPSGHIIRRHIFPLVLPIILAQNALVISSAILSESALSFLGLGDPTLISWGSMLNFAFGRGAVSVGAWWALLPPGLAIVWVVLAWTLLGHVIEEIVNPRLKTHHLMPEQAVGSQQ